MKVGLLLPGNISLCPFVEIFTKILQTRGIQYDIISWDRALLGDGEQYVYTYRAPLTFSFTQKLVAYYKFSRYAKRIISQNKYDKLIVFGAAIGVFMYRFLNKKYHGRIWLDYRDLGMEQRFTKRFKDLCDICEFISISSPGYVGVFPNKYDFILSHNFDIDIVRKVLDSDLAVPAVTASNHPIMVSTVGSIRDYEVNRQVLDSLKNDTQFQIKFVGKGISVEDLKKYARIHHIQNVEFYGYYKKDEEGTFYKEADLINIYLPTIVTHSTPMANRFYNALIYRKPMLVTKYSTQAWYIEKYDLGLSVEDVSDLGSNIKTYLKTHDAVAYTSRCNLLLREFVCDFDHFEKKLIQFIESCHLIQTN